jgi:hypothetical protein
VTSREARAGLPRYGHIAPESVWLQAGYAADPPGKQRQLATAGRKLLQF